METNPMTYPGGQSNIMNYQSNRKGKLSATARAIRTVADDG